MMLNKKVFIYFNVLFFLLLYTFSKGIFYPIAKLLQNALDFGKDIYGQILTASIRFYIVATVSILILMYFKKLFIKYEKKDIILLILIGVFQSALQYIFFYIGMAHSGAVKTAIMGATTSFYLLIFSRIWGNETLNWKKILGVTIGVLGSIFVDFDSSKLTLDFTLFGEGALILMAISSALGTLFVSKLSKNIPISSIISWQAIIGMLTVVFILFLVPNTKNVEIHWSFYVISLFCVLAAFYFLMFYGWYKLVKLQPLSTISVYRCLNPILGAGLSLWIIKQEIITLEIFISLVLVVAGIFLVSIDDYRKVND